MLAALEDTRLPMLPLLIDRGADGISSGALSHAECHERVELILNPHNTDSIAASKSAQVNCDARLVVRKRQEETFEQVFDDWRQGVFELFDTYTKLVGDYWKQFYHGRRTVTFL
jgi:hypothetical protein